MEDINENYFEELQCPFTWNIYDIVTDAKVGKLDKLLQKNEEVSGQRWIDLLLSVATAYEFYMNGEKSTADNELMKSINILENEKKDEFLNKYKKAFQHVVYSVKLFFMRDKETTAKINEVRGKIPPYSELSPEQKVAITGIKANIFAEYGIPGSIHALELAREALKENPKEAEWSFMVGILLGRIRHYTSDDNITDEELRCMEDAYKQNRTSQNAVFLAQTYLDYAKYIRFAEKFVRDGKEMVYRERLWLNDEYNKKSYNLFREALRFNENNKCIHIKIRSINGLFKLIQSDVRRKKRPIRSEDLQELFSAINQCFKEAPNNAFCNDVASRMYFALDDNQNGFKYAEIAAKFGCYGAFINIIEKKIELNIKFDSEEIFKEALTKYSNDLFLYQTYVFAMGYYIFQEYNISLMLKYFFMASEKNMKREDFSRYFIFIQKKIDVCPVVYNEVKLTLYGRNYKNANELKQLEKALEIFHSLYPDVEQEEVQIDLIEKLQKRKIYK